VETVKWPLFTCFIPSFHRKKKHRNGQMAFVYLFYSVISQEEEAF